MKRLTRYLRKGSREERRLHSRSTGRWEELGKRLGVVATTLAIATAAITATAWVYEKFWSVPRIVLRQQAWTPSDKLDVFDLRFTVLNPTAAPIYLNALYFLEGPLTAGTGFGAALKVPEYYDQVEVSDLQIESALQKGAVPVIPRSSRHIRVPKVSFIRHPIFTANRTRLEANEQLDYRLVVKVTRPSALDPTKLTDPQIQAQLAVRWETVKGEPSTASCFVNLLYFHR